MLLAVSICSLWTSTFICSKTGEAILTTKVFDQLTSLRTAKAYQIQDYFKTLIHHTQTLSNDLMFVAALKEFKTAYSELVKSDVPAEFDQKIDTYYNQEFLPKLSRTVEGTILAAAFTPSTTIAHYLQYHYIAANKNSSDKKYLLDNPGDKSNYSNVHTRYHPIFRDIADKFGYYDIYLIDTGGNIVYSLDKEVDFGTNLTLGPYKESNLAKALVEARLSNSKNFVKIADFEPYQPSYGAPVAFIAAPIIEGKNLIGVLAFKLPVDEINRIMTGNKDWKKNGLGNTGETYLVGRDYLMRSVSRLFVEDPKRYKKLIASLGSDKRTVQKIKEYNTTILLQEVQTQAVKEAYFGKEATQIVNNYRNIPVLSSYAPIEINGLRWIILAEIDVAEAYEPIYKFERQVLIAATFIMLIITLVAMWLTKIFVKPIKTLISSTRKIGSGETDTTLILQSQDEFGQLSKSFNETIQRLQSQASLIEHNNRENEKILLSILPATIVSRIKRGEKDIADQISNVSVLFSDLHRFTRLSQTKRAQEVVSLLNELVTGWDEIAEKYGIEKIKILGDGYMAVCGLSVPRLDHDKRTVDFALEMLAMIRRFNYHYRYEYSSAPVGKADISSRKLAQNLHTIPVFVPLAKEPENLDYITKGTTLQHFGAGEKVIRQSENSDELFIIVAGEAVLTVTNNSFEEQVVMSLTRGEFFGEMALFSGEPNPASVMAIDDLEVMVIHSEVVNTMIERQPSLAREIGQIIEARRKAINTVLSSTTEVGVSL